MEPIKIPSKKAIKEQEAQEAAKILRGWLEQTLTVYTSLKHVSRSGMMRHIACYASIIDERTGAPDTVNITYYVAKVLDDKIADDGGIKIGGCGMDMGFHLVYSLSRRLYGTAYPCDGEKCTSSDHVNGVNERKKGAHQHTDSGYRLSQRWL